MNIDLNLDDELMKIRDLPLYGKGQQSEDKMIRSDFEEYRALGRPSIDSHTMHYDISDILMDEIDWK